MRLTCAIPLWRLTASVTLLCLIGLLGQQVGGDESTTAKARRTRGDVSTKSTAEVPQREPIRIAERQEHNELDPSIEEAPALPTYAPPSESDAGDPPVSPSPPSRGTMPQSDAAWPLPASLLTQLDELAKGDPKSADWAVNVRSELDKLHALPTLTDQTAAVRFQNLSELAEQARQIARELSDDDSRSSLLRGGYALVRRLAVWEPAANAGAASGLPTPAMAAEARQRLRLLVPAIAAELPRTGDVATWRQYLLLDHLRGELEQPGQVSDNLRTLAREVLYRLHSTQLSEVQSEFLEGPVFRRLSAELRTLATQPTDISAALRAVEAYELEERASAAVKLASVYDRLRWSADPHVARLAEAINTYYRNANVRVAVSAELVNRLLPGEQVTSEPVVDRIQNADVAGHSQTSTKVRVVLLPTRGEWQFGIEANGDVASNTTSSAGPARFHQWGWSNFRARKRMTIDRRGIRLFQAEAQANADTQLNDFETEFDGIPLLGGLARAVARNQYEQKSPAARSEVEGKISYRASAELDRQVAERLEKGKQDFQRQLVRPLQELQLEPTAVDMETTQERLIARYRLAGRDQASAYTPRPQAPGDSLLSVQVHESALNNVLTHLGLEGRRVNLVTLYGEMTERFAEKKVPVPEDIPDDVFVTFADEDPVRIDCEDGHVRLTIRLKRLELGQDDQWYNLTVRARYVPDPGQLDANMVRDGVFTLSGERNLDGDPLGLGDRGKLSAIFGKVLNRNRKLNLINERLSTSPQLGDQQVTQFVIHDGWIGIALGPKTPERQALLKQPSPQ
ncbi:MAG TPA: hypothetical protein VMP01_03985 [Pirellulaceae bacterium]|nr:hypothetical protein [Pirellulaceae bacterium]